MIKKTVNSKSKTKEVGIRNKLICLFYLLLRDEIPVGRLRHAIMTIPFQEMINRSKAGQKLRLERQSLLKNDIKYSDQKLLQIAKELVGLICNGEPSHSEMVSSSYKSDHNF